jgi:hypothetical protein
VRAAVPIADTIYLEPDLYRPSMSDRTDPSIQAVLRDRHLRSAREPKPPRDAPPAKPKPATGSP